MLIIANEREEAVATYQSVKSSIHRNKRKEVPPQPENRKDLHIPGLWRQTLDGRNFILCDDGLDDKIVIFGTPEIFSKMCDAKTLFLDAKANSLGKCLLPTTFQLDFETTMFNTIKNKYPDAQIRGCFFHYTQAVYRKVVNVGLRNDYISSEGDPLIKTLVRRISALPLVPIKQLDDLWLIIESEKPENNEKLDDLTTRFRRYIWNHWTNTDRRTTNDLDGWYYALNKAAGRNHPSIFEFIVILQKEHAKIEDDMKLLQRGKKVKRIYKKYVKLEQRICSLKERVTSDPPQMKWIDYLDNIS
ncbi:MULE domain-containing protein [Aphis craccivora]|uniref:MULE domain-containing protein n=1 Tax=Aphis craccivora TaxID=307492 RepID=A0A6G0Y022_APHCR|nr:MULE domain-containing protein [Aphis craccivora]